MRRILVAVLAVAAAAMLPACSSDDAAEKPDAPAAERGSGQGSSSVDAGSSGSSAAAAGSGLTRSELNRIAAELYLPLFWTRDIDGDGQLDAKELAVLWGLPGTDSSWESWVVGDRLTPKAMEAIARIQEVKAKGPPLDGLSIDELKRRKAVLAELAQGRPTLVLTDLTSASDEDKQVVRHILNAALLIEELHARQNATLGMIDLIPPDDVASRALLHRNQGPWCAAPKTESDPDCHGLVAKPARRSGLYPAALQEHGDFCDMLAARPDQRTLMSPFVAVVEKGGAGELAPLPYHEAYADLMEKVASELEAAAGAIQDPSEHAFREYLLADAKAFRTNQWEDADEAWARMNAENSKWYLRLAPDEVYFEPCARKAGFHVSFARINQGSLEWQRKLEPVKREMEKALAALAGPPYEARDVAFHLPDFIDIVVNAGDSRSPHGATIGQSLPNWGRVADAGGRTVAMTNLYTDDDSKRAMAEQAQSMFCADTMALVDMDPGLGVMSTVLHEAAHNLGPSHEYKVNGKVDDEVFGGPLASTLEEMKAQTSALYFADWLAQRGIITAEEATKAHLRDVMWAFGHISRGMYTPTGQPKAYSQLAAMQVGFLLEKGAVEWRAEQKAANGSDAGCMAVNVDKLAPAIDALAREVLRIKGSGDKAAAEALKKAHVDDDGAWKDLRKVIEERWLRSEKATFVYSIRW